MLRRYPTINPLVYIRSYFVECPSGTIKMVYRRPEYAFPLCVEGFDVGLSGGIDAAVLQKVNISSHYRKNVQELLVHLDDINGDLPNLFRAAYVQYQADPCENADLFNRRIEEITARHHRLRSAKVAIAGYIAMIQQNGDSSLLEQRFLEIANMLGFPEQQSVSAAFRGARGAVETLKEKQR